MKTREEEINRAYYTEKKRYESEMLHRKSFERGALWADRSLLKKLSTTDCSLTSRLHNIWHGIKQRCNNPKATGYKLYGGKGIKICEEWENNYILFVVWAILNGYSNELSIDRIDSNGNYEPNNCRFVDSITQNNNTSRNVRIGNFTIAEYARRSGINYRTIHNRVTRGGMTIEDAITSCMHNPKRVQQLSLDGSVIREFSSAIAAAITLGGDKHMRTHIQDVCNGRRKTAYGYKFKYI